MPGWINVDNQMRKIKDIYIGIDNKPRKVTNSWIGVNSQPRHWYTHKIIPNEQTILIHLHPVYKSLLAMRAEQPSISIFDSLGETKVLDDVYVTTSKLRDVTILGDKTGLLSYISLTFDGQFDTEWNQSVTLVQTDGQMPTAGCPVFEFPFPSNNETSFEFSIETPISIVFYGLNGGIYLVDDYVSDIERTIVIDDAISEIEISPKIYLKGGDSNS